MSLHCSYCGKQYKRKDFHAKHEKKCSENIQPDETTNAIFDEILFAESFDILSKNTQLVELLHLSENTQQPAKKSIWQKIKSIFSKS